MAAALALSGAALGAVASSASAATLPGGQTLTTGSQVHSANGSYRLIMQTDGNLVEYSGSTALWASGPAGSGNHATMQSDGNLVVYSSGNAALWQSATYGHPGSVLQLQNDSNLVIYQGSTAIWARTSSRTLSSVSNRLVAGQWINSPSGQYKLIMQTDGNLVEYSGSTALWASGTAGSGNHATMQGDGNFVVYASNGAALWQTGTAGTPGSPTLDVQNDGNIVIYEVSGAIWAKSSSRTTSSVSSTLWPGQTIGSPNGRYRLTMQTDGNLVEYGPSGALWATSTNGTTNHVTLQTDGNLVVYTSGNVPRWQSGTGGHTSRSGTLDVQNDANVVVYQVTGATWSRLGGATGGSAVAWANAHNGEVYGTAAEQPASAHQWSGYCWTFVYDAFGGTVPREPTAQDGWNFYSAKGMTHTGAPPAGAIAFWSYGTDGHAAVSTGGGMTIGTHGTSTDRYPVFSIAYNNRGLTYLGWVAP